MAKKVIQAQMQQRRDTAANWAASNPVLLDGEMGIVTDDPNLYKVGDGVTAWNDLKFRGFDGTLVQTTGDSENAVISQKAVTEKLTELESEVEQTRKVASVINFNAPFSKVGYYNAGGGLVTASNSANTGKIYVQPYQKLKCNTNLDSLSLAIAFWDKNDNLLSDISVKGHSEKVDELDLTKAEYKDAYYVAVSSYSPSGNFSTFYCELSSQDSIQNTIQDLEHTLEDNVSKVNEFLGGSFVKTYDKSMLADYYWNGSKFVGGTATYDGICIRCKKGWSYNVDINPMTAVVSTEPPAGNVAAQSTKLPFVASEEEQYLYLTYNVSSADFSVNVTESKDGAGNEFPIIKAEVADIKDEFGLYSHKSYDSSNFYGLSWSGTAFMNYVSLGYNGILVPLIEGASYSVPPTNGVISSFLLSDLPKAGQSSMIIEAAPTSFVATEAKYLYLSVKVDNFSSVKITEEKDGILPSVKTLETYWGKSAVAGKKAIIFGDSITCTNKIGTNGELTFYKYNWSYYAMQELGIDFYNYAQDGGGWLDSSSLSEYQQVSNQIALATSQHEKTDMVILSLGTNNWGAELDSFEDAVAITDIESLDRTKPYQAIRYALWKLRTTYPTARFFVFLPLQRKGQGNDYFIKSNIFIAIRKMAELYGCFVFDQFSEVGICSVNERAGANGLYLSDGLHPNERGQKMQAKYAAKKILGAYIEDEFVA